MCMTTHRVLRSTLVVLMSCGAVALAVAGMREYRRSQWRGKGEALTQNCTTRLTDEAAIDAKSADRVCRCLFDYISVRWTPDQYSAQRAAIERTMASEHVSDACLNLAGGWSSHQP
jgi:hypothetical protein